LPVSFLRLERVVHWERIASRWRPAFSSHLINALTGQVAAGTDLGNGPEIKAAFPTAYIP
jgi:hypothetical protein